MSGISAPDQELIVSFIKGAEELEAAVRGLSEDQLNTCLAPGEWSIRQIIHHLAEDCDVWSMVIKKALVIPGKINRLVEGFPGNDIWAAGLQFDRREITTAVALITAHRQYLASLLRDLPERWDNEAALANAAGEIKKTLTVRQIIEMLNGHTDEHLATIRHIKEKQA